MFLAFSAQALYAQPANSVTTTCAFSSAGGYAISANFASICIIGQASPVETSANANYQETGGFLAMLQLPAIAGQVLATPECPSSFSQDCSVNVTLRIDLTGTLPESRLASFAGTLRWDPTLLAYFSHSGLLSGFAGVVITDSAALGKLAFSGSNPAGRGGLVGILRIGFKVVGRAGQSGRLSQAYSTLISNPPPRSLLPLLALNDCVFSIKPADHHGDLNGDGFANSTDALIIMSYDLGLFIPPPILDRIMAGVGDVNRDGQTDIADALIVLTFDVGIPVTFPVGEVLCSNTGSKPVQRHLEPTPQ